MSSYQKATDLSAFISISTELGYNKKEEKKERFSRLKESFIWDGVFMNKNKKS